MSEAPSKSKKSNIYYYYNKYSKYFIVVALVISIAIAVTPSSPTTYHKDKAQIIYIDFLLYYRAAILVNNGNSNKIYNLEFQQENLSNIIGAPTKKLIPYLYPPQSLLFFAPLASFSLENSFLIWNIINIASIILILIGFTKICTKKSNALLITSILTLTSHPWITNAYYGQVVILMVIGLWGSQLLAEKKHMLLASLFLVLTAFKPPLILAPALYLLIIHGKQFWYSIIAVSIITIAICSAIFGISIWQSYIEIMLTASRQTDDMGANLSQMCSIRALVLLLLGENHLSGINLFSTILWIGSVIATIYIALKSRYKTKKIQELGFGLAIAISCLFSPWLHIYSLLILIIPIGYLVKYTNFKKPHLLIAGAINFNLIAMYIYGLAPKLNSALWVPAQILLITFIAYNLYREHKKACTVAVVS